jgi:hypothetical protein
MRIHGKPAPDMRRHFLHFTKVILPQLTRIYVFDS